MTKSEFLEQLETKLQSLGVDERRKTLQYYSEMIDDRIEDGISEDEATESLGTVEAIMAEIETDTAVNGTVTEKQRTNKLWIVLSIAGFPIWLPLSIAAAAIVIALIACILAVMICVAVIPPCLIISAAAGLIKGAIVCFTGYPVFGFALIGLSISAIGLFIMSFKPIYWLCKKTVKVIIRTLTSLWNRIKSLKKKVAI